MFRHAPTSSRYLVGSLLGSFVGAAILVLLAVLSFEQAVDARRYFSFVVFITCFMFVPFLVIGWPLLLLLRGTRWFRFPLAACVGAVAGLAATVLFGGPSFDRVSLVFAGIGVLASAVCWWIMSIRPNMPLNTDAGDKAGRR